MSNEFEAYGRVAEALFTLRVHRGDGMALLAMNWKVGRPPDDFVGFAIEYREPGGTRFFSLKNRLSFAGAGGKVSGIQLSTMLSPIQKFRWVHFPRNAEMDGPFQYRVTPVFMNERDELSYGVAQEASIVLARETVPSALNVAYTRGFVSSQAFVDRYLSAGPISTLLPEDAEAGLDFRPSHPRAGEALEWMGFEARRAILDTLDLAIADPRAQVRVVAYDLNLPEIVERLERLGPRLKIIIDDSDDHGAPGSGETRAAARLAASAGADNVKRQHMGDLQHNKTIVVEGPTVKRAVCGSTNFSWRGFYVQSNNAVVVEGASAIAPFLAAFDRYWASDAVPAFGAAAVADWVDLGLPGVDAKITFSPHAARNAMLNAIADDLRDGTTSSLFYSLAFLYQTRGPIRDAITELTADDALFVYGISDRKVGGLDLQKPNGNLAPVYPSALTKNVPEPFKQEATGGGGIRMHHKFLVVDFDRPTARVYLGSYNFSSPADRKNGENLVLVRDRRIAVSYMVEALRIFDHHHFRVAQAEASRAAKTLRLKRPPREAGETPWWLEDWTDHRKSLDRELFA